MSTQAKLAIFCLLAMFGLMRVGKYLFRPVAANHAAAATWLPVMSAAAFGCGIFVFLLFARRVRASKKPDGKPVQWWGWATLGLLTLVYLSEPAAFFVGFAQALLERGSK